MARGLFTVRKSPAPSCFRRAINCSTETAALAVLVVDMGNLSGLIALTNCYPITNGCAHHRNPGRLDYLGYLLRRLYRNHAAYGHRIGMYPAAVGDYHAVLRLSRLHRTVFAVLGRDLGRDRVQPWIRGGLRDRLLWGKAAGRGLRALHLPEQARA